MADDENKSTNEETPPESAGKETPPEGKEKPPADEQYTIKVDGEERSVTLQEMQQMAEKAGGADSRFQEAAKLRKEAARGVRVQELFDTLAGGEKPQDSDVSELAGLLGLDPSELLNTIKSLDVGEPDTGKGGKKGSAEAKEKDKKLTMEQLPADVQEILKESQIAQYEKKVAEVKETCAEAIDKDEILGKIIGKRADAEEQKAVKGTLIDIVFEDVQRKILAREQYGPDMVKASVQRARNLVNKLGIPSKTSKDSLAVLGLGPSGQLPAEVHADEPIGRVSSTDSGYEDNAVKRVMQSFVKQSRQQ